MDESAGDRSVYVTTDQEDRFFVPMRDAVEHIRVGEGWKVWVDEFNAVLGHVHAWATEHAGAIAACTAVIKDGSRVRVLVAPSLDSFDGDLADELVELELSLLHVSRLVDSHVSQISASAVKDAVAASAGHPSFDLTKPPA